jgi:cell division protein CrgA
MTSKAKPSPPWFGGLILACLALATAWILTYTLAPLPGQNALGGWNYVAVGVLLTLFVGLSMEWHGDPPKRRKTEARNRSSDRRSAGSAG